ncbi:MAG: toxin TcdB middle/C-terminal domain-containing protein [Gemmatimonadaceae bacterium]
MRQEVYGLDSTEKADRPYSVLERNYTIRALQPRAANRHSVFFTHARETIDVHYERQLFPVVNGTIVDDAAAAITPDVEWRADPRVSHAMVLQVDKFGNVEQSLALAYGRRFDDSDSRLTDADRAKQKKLAAVLTDATFTNAVEEPDAYRAPLPAEEPHLRTGQSC